MRTREQELTKQSVSADGTAAASDLPNGASAANSSTKEQEQAGAKMSLEDLFKDVWMAEEEEPEPEAADKTNHVPDTEVCGHALDNPASKHHLCICAGAGDGDKLVGNRTCPAKLSKPLDLCIGIYASA